LSEELYIKIEEIARRLSEEPGSIKTEEINLAGTSEVVFPPFIWQAAWRRPV